MYELTIGDKRLSTIGAELRTLKLDAAKLIAEELKKVKGLVACIKGETDLANLSLYSARAYQHVKNMLQVSVVVDIPAGVQHREEGSFLYNVLYSHPLYRESAELIQLAIALEIIETNPANWL